MLAYIQFITVFAATLYAGVAIYINLVEHPARMNLKTKPAAQEWAPSYRRATILQAVLAAFASAGGVTVWLLIGGTMWATGTIIMLLVIPVSLLLILPVNYRLTDPDRDKSSDRTRELLEQWGYRHTLRTILSVVAAIIFTWQVVSALPKADVVDPILNSAPISNSIQPES
ncbi:DUF1772 domain-containing protein [Pseudidiomarina salinarum]|uniref:DUF1772 domain-containing protein n=1 Tax=Pseudidiomarina salinarum TaxID=435908 RepID=UPI0006897DD4|nr:DUF1772 domain-containing protein [Pseudidiomarina salinarum]RUO70315.1 DUF1772 domain-containing protein [Pseudidiomarina salinarum]